MIELVIKLPEENYERMKFMWKMGTLNPYLKAIAIGTPLPKGHGQLIDKKDIDANCITYHTDYDGSWCYRVTDIENNVPTIVEADKEEEDKE